MLQVARVAPRALGDASELVRGFLRSQIAPCGSFRDRSGAPDIYYTLFGLEALSALQETPPEALRETIASNDPAELDLIHLGALARIHATIGTDSDALRASIAARIPSFRVPQGGYSVSPHDDTGSLYGVFVALGLYQDLLLPIPEPESLLSFVEGLRSKDGGYANFPDIPGSQTPATAAAITILRQLDQRPDPAIAEWLLARHYPEGGFFVHPTAPIPDLLSTAVALHALSSLNASLDAVREPCLDFLDSLWTNRGSFYAHWQEDILDAEYTWYALLALGHLALH